MCQLGPTPDPERGNVQPDERAVCAHDYVRSDLICTECGERATALQANTVALPNNSSAPLSGHIFAAVPQAGAMLTEVQREGLQQVIAFLAEHGQTVMASHLNSISTAAVQPVPEIQKGQEYDWTVEEVRDLFPGSAGNGQ